MSRSEDPLIVRAELDALSRETLRDLLVPVLRDCRHAANTVPDFIGDVRMGIFGSLASEFDRLGLLVEEGA